MGGVTVDYRLSNYAGYNPNDVDWYFIWENRRILSAQNRSVTTATLATMSAVFSFTPDVSNPPAFPLSATLEMFVIAGDPAAADAINATASDTTYVATVNAKLMEWWPDTNGTVTYIRMTREVYHPPGEDNVFPTAIVVGVVGVGLVFVAVAVFMAVARRQSKTKVSPSTASKLTGKKLTTVTAETGEVRRRSV